MRTALTAIGLAGLLLGLTVPGAAHQGDRVYPFFELTDADLAMIDLQDGSVDDWLEVLGEPTLTALDFIPVTEERVSNHPSDLDFRIWLAWHDATNRIYVAMERADDDFVNEFDRAGVLAWLGFWDGGIIFMVDGDHSGGLYMGDDLDTDMLRWYGQAQSYHVLGEVYDAGGHVDLGYRTPGLYSWEEFFLLPPYAEGGGGAFGENPTLSVTEFYVTPFDRLVWNSQEESLVSELGPGQVIGLMLSVAEIDGECCADQGYLHLGGEVGYSADGFVDGVLMGAVGGPDDESAVENITWARIKAQFVE